MALQAGDQEEAGQAVPQAQAAGTQQAAVEEEAGLPVIELAVPQAKAAEPQAAPEEKALQKASQAKAAEPQAAPEEKALQEASQAKAAEPQAAPEEKALQEASQRYPRLEFAQQVFEVKASLGNPNMSTKNVVVVPRDRVLAWIDGFPKFEDCRADEHVVAADLVGTPRARILFFSHRWQYAKKNLADSSDNIQYAVLKLYLESCDGQGITHVWIDLSCINQDRGTKDQPNPQGLKEFLIKLDNIGTAICCSAEVLVVPRLHQMEGVPEGHYYSDLQEYTGRGWCVFESAMARMMGCEIRLGLVCGPVGDARFARMGGSGLAPGKELSLEELRRGLGKMKGGHNLKRAALPCLPPAGEEGEEEGPLRRAARANWEGAFDPGAVLADVCRFLCEDLRNKDREKLVQREAATLTMRLDANKWDYAPLAVERVSALLPEEGFTAVRDKEVVTALLVNGGAFILTGFEEVLPRPEWELRALVLEKLDLDNCWGGPTLDLDRQGLLPCEVGSVLAALTTPGGEEGALAGLGGRPLCLNLWSNPIGPHGVRCLREAVAGGGLPPLRRLYLWRCGLGVAGALHLADLLRDPAAAALEQLHMKHNGVGAEGARALAEALPRCPALEELGLWDNEVGDEGARALAEVLPRCPALCNLDLQDNGVGDEGARALAEALPRCPGLRTLILKNNEVGGEGARALAEALPRCPGLRTLRLVGNGVGEEAAAAVRVAWAVPLPPWPGGLGRAARSPDEDGGLYL